MRFICRYRPSVPDFDPTPLIRTIYFGSSVTVFNGVPLHMFWSDLTLAHHVSIRKWRYLSRCQLVTEMSFIFARCHCVMRAIDVPEHLAFKDLTHLRIQRKRPL